VASETVGDALVVTIETQRLLTRAIEAVQQSARFGPRGLFEFVEPVERLRKALETDVPELERIIALRLR
jgi:hypothetical protein